jgi:hypothetical protein
VSKKDKKRAPAVAKSPGQDRSPQAGEKPDDIMRQTPHWCFRHLDARGSSWSWETDDADHKIVKALERLRDLAGSTWMEIEQEKGRKSNGPIEISKLASGAQARIRALSLEKFDPFYHLRVEKAVRVWGYRLGRVLHVVWLDRHHTVYPTLEK